MAHYAEHKIPSPLEFANKNTTKTPITPHQAHLIDAITQNQSIKLRA